MGWSLHFGHDPFRYLFFVSRISVGHIWNPCDFLNVGVPQTHFRQQLPGRIINSPRLSYANSSVCCHRDRLLLIRIDRFHLPWKSGVFARLCGHSRSGRAVFAQTAGLAERSRASEWQACLRMRLWNVTSALVFARRPLCGADACLRSCLWSSAVSLSTLRCSSALCVLFAVDGVCVALVE